MISSFDWLEYLCPVRAFFLKKRKKRLDLLNLNACQTLFSFLAQWSMRALASNGCRVMEGDFTSDWTGGGMLLELSFMWICIWRCLSYSGQQGPSALDPNMQLVPQWFLGNTHGWGKSWSKIHFCVYRQNITSFMGGIVHYPDTFQLYTTIKWLLPWVVMKMLYILKIN